MKTNLNTILVVLLLCTATAAAEPHAGKLYERYVAIDNACGWPTLTLLPDGDIMCLLWPYPNHGVSEGAAQVWHSPDGGLQWTYHSTPIQNRPGENRMLMAAGLNNRDEYIVMIGGHDRRVKPPGWSQKGEPDISQYFMPGTETYPITATYDTASQGWRVLPELDTREPSGKVGVPYGRINPITDDEIGVMIYHNLVRFYTSRDQGETWKVRGTLPDIGDFHISFDETAWIKLGNGDLYAASRRSNLIGFRSKDNGTTWEREEPLTMHGQHPGDLTRLADGRILLTFGVRNLGMFGIAYVVGDENARNWSRPAMLVNLQAADLGYPSTVEVSPGTLVTAYYSGGIPEHTRYHVGIVKWEITK